MEEEEEYAEEKMYRMRRLVIVDNSLDFSTTDPGMVGGDEKELEASLQPLVCLNNFCSDFVSSSEQDEEDVDREEQLRRVSPHRKKKSKRKSKRNSFSEEPQEQPRTAGFSVVGGDVGMDPT